MSETLTLQQLALTVEQQATELARLNERLEDLEDLRDLQDAITRNAGLPLHSWEAAREALGLTDEEFIRAATESRKDGQSAED